MRKKNVGLAAVAAFCAFGLTGVAGALDYNLSDLQAKLEAQEERISDFEAKLNGGGDEDGEKPDSIISLRKNAKVSIGGQINTKYTYTNANVKGFYTVDNNGDTVHDADDLYRRRATAKNGSLEISDAYLHIQVDVNDHFEARVELDLQNTETGEYRIPEVAYVNWKNICESGFGLKVGRDALTFGADGFGELGAYTAGGGDGLSELDEGFHGFLGMPIGQRGVGSEAIAGIIPMHNGWDVSGIPQVTPYWEGLDGALSFELSLFTNAHEDTAYYRNPTYVTNRNGVDRYRTRNYGFGSFATRVTYEPIEDLKFTLSAANYRSRGADDLRDPGDRAAFQETFTSNNFVYGLAASYRPCFVKPLNVWAQWVHGNNVYYYRGMKSDAINVGASWDFTDSLTFFAQGDYLRTSYKQGESDGRGTAWAFYTGLQYNLPYGVSLETGWKHEKVTYKSHGQRMGRAKADTIYALAGFEF